MNLIRSFFIAFSMYSKIPMPRTDWTKEAMRYAMCFFPGHRCGHRRTSLSLDLSYRGQHRKSFSGLRSRADSA